MEHNKYHRGKIYTIRSHLTDLVYVGSTTNTLTKRFDQHKRNYKCHKTSGKYKYVSIFELFEQDPNCYIELYENYRCNDKNELTRREGQVIRDLDCVNKIIAGRTAREYREDNKEQRKQYREDNKERIRARKNQPYYCQCGGSTTLTHKPRHFRSKIHKKWEFGQHQIFNHL